MSNLFENLELLREEEGRERKRAAILANARARGRFTNFLKSASPEEFDSKLALIEDDLSAIIRESCDEENFSDYRTIQDAVVANLRQAAEPASDGDSYWKERVDLPKADPSGLSDEASGQKFDPEAHGDWRGWQTPKLDVPSNEHPSEMQDIEEAGDLWSDTKVPGLIDKQNVEEDSTPEPAAGTETFPAGNQAQPVTSATYPDVDYYDAGQQWSEPTKPDFDPRIPGPETISPTEEEQEYGPTVLDNAPENAISDAYQALLSQGKTPDEALQHINAFIDKLHSEKFNEQPDSHLDDEDLASMHLQGERDAPLAGGKVTNNANVQTIPQAQANQDVTAMRVAGKWRIV